MKQDEEPELLAEFKQNVKQAERWFIDGYKVMKNPHFDDYFARVGKEMQLISEAKDIQNEIRIVADVLEEQSRLLGRFKETVREDITDQRSTRRLDLRTTFDAQLANLQSLLGRLDKLDREADEFQDTVSKASQTVTDVQ